MYEFKRNRCMYENDLSVTEQCEYVVKMLQGLTIDAALQAGLIANFTTTVKRIRNNVDNGRINRTEFVDCICDVVNCRIDWIDEFVLGNVAYGTFESHRPTMPTAEKFIGEARAAVLFFGIA